MFYWYLEKLGLQDFDFDQFFRNKPMMTAVLLDEIERNSIPVICVRSVNKECIVQLFRSGYFHFWDGTQVHAYALPCKPVGCSGPIWTKFRVDHVAFSEHEGFVLSGYFDHWAWGDETDRSPEQAHFECVPQYRRPPDSPDPYHVF